MPFPNADKDGRDQLYPIFRDPPDPYKPFVRWWWNGDRVQKDELARELRVLAKAGIGGVEINPIRFPARTADMGIPAVNWLSPEWLELVGFATDEARSLGMQADLIVGSGWPYGSEDLPPEERSQVMVIATKKLEGPLDYEVSLFELFREADPQISSPFPGRQMEMQLVYLSPASLNRMEEVNDLSDQIASGRIRVKIPAGKHVLYGLVRISGFMKVIQGAPGATGPVLDHYQAGAVEKFLRRMGDALNRMPGSLAKRFRALFTDSLELEGANWTTDFREAFIRRRGYDLLPYLPFVLFKIGSMGNTWSYDHGAEQGPAFKEMISRMRYDFERTRTELLEERFAASFASWCKQLGVQSRMQAYGRGYYPLEGSWDPDIPEAETWIRKGLGKEMSEQEYATGRAYTVVNKFVSSAAHLQGKRLVSCEELTNIHQVFNETLDLLKVAGDQSLVSGTNHSIFHGFNYSPPEAAFPGWVIYGSYLSERNPWWPYFEKFARYKTRLSALFQQGEMFADIAILAPTADLWSQYGSQNDPFPAVMYPGWLTHLWESIHQNGGGCDYVSEGVIRDSKAERGGMVFGNRFYHTLFLARVESIEPATARKLVELAAAGLRIFCIDTFPSKAPGWKDAAPRDAEVQQWMEKLKAMTYQCFQIAAPSRAYLNWFSGLCADAGIKTYLEMDQPNAFVSQVRYRFADADAVFLAHSHLSEPASMTIRPAGELTQGRQAWRWDPETGERRKVKLVSGYLNLELGPAESVLLVFDKNTKGEWWNPPPRDTGSGRWLEGPWLVRGEHVDGSRIERKLEKLEDLSGQTDWAQFAGILNYICEFSLPSPESFTWIDLGRVYGVAEVWINGKSAGVKWFGRRILPLGSLLQPGFNRVEIRVTTTVGNFLKASRENAAGQFWTNEGRTIQPVQPIGLEGPVQIY